MTTTYITSRLKRASLIRAGLFGALICSGATFAALPAMAQDTTSQRLTQGAANQQVPPAFPDQTGAPVAPATGGAALAGSPSSPFPPAAGATQSQNKPQTAAPSQTVQQNAAGDQSTTASPILAQPVTGQVPAGAASATSPAAATPPTNQVPAQPEERKLVPATAMGTAAQNVENGQGGTDGATDQPQQQPSSSIVQDDIPEQAEASEDDSAPIAKPTASGLPDILQKYGAKADETADMQGAPEQGGDALPEVNNLNMVKLNAPGFENGNQRTNVAIDPNAPTGKTNAALQEEIRTEAFDAAITGVFPLSPDQIETLLKRYDTTQKAVTKPPYDAPKPEISVQNISLDPGMTPPVIKTAVGNVTTINMLDATGAPWPVQDVTWAGDYEIVEPEEGGHIIRITPMSQFAHGNIVIRLLTLKTPLTMTLETGRDVVQYRVDARIPEYGPFASAPLMQGAKSTMVAGSPDLTSLLDGVMPGGMVKLEVAGVDGRTTAFAMNGTTYVRTPLTLLSPAWQSSVSSADGMNVYALTNAPVLLLSDGGEFQRATLKEKEDLLDE
jgi:intracellular multiplication protein IcmK